MMKLACKDISPDTDCHFEARGGTATEVAKKMMTHARTHHTEDVKKMTDAEMMSAFELKAHE